MKPLLVSPAPGSAVALETSDIVVSVGASSTWHVGLLVVADETVLVEGRNVTKASKLIRLWEHGGRIFMRLRKLGGWSRGHVLVQISSEEAGSSVNQYFFVRGAALLAPNIGRAVGRVPGGYFWQETNRWIIAGQAVPLPCDMPEGSIIGPACVYYKTLGLVGWVSDGVWRSSLLPKNLFSDLASIKMGATSSGYAVVALDSSGGVTAICNDKMHYWPQAGACQVGITSGWIHANMYTHSAHLPWAYAAYPLERTLEHWWVMERDDGLGSREHLMEWGESVHVWHNKREIIALNEPDPIMGKSDSVLWLDQDFQAPINTVELLGGAYALINGVTIANLKNPSIEELS